MKEILLDEEGLHRGNLILVNREFPLKGEPKKQEIRQVKGTKEQLLLEAAESLESLFSLLSLKDKAVCVSGLRSSKEQKKISVWRSIFYG